MNETYIIGILFSVIQAAFWLWVRTSIAKTSEIEKAHETLKDEFADYKLSIAEHYVKHTQLDARMDLIYKSLDEIKGMIEKLADK